MSEKVASEPIADATAPPAHTDPFASVAFGSTDQLRLHGFPADAIDAADRTIRRCWQKGVQAHDVSEGTWVWKLRGGCVRPTGACALTCGAGRKPVDEQHAGRARVRGSARSRGALTQAGSGKGLLTMLLWALARAGWAAFGTCGLFVDNDSKDALLFRPCAPAQASGAPEGPCARVC
jgi:hypothetical protein